MGIDETRRDKLVAQVDDFGIGAGSQPDFLISADGDEFFVFDGNCSRLGVPAV